MTKRNNFCGPHCVAGRPAIQCGEMTKFKWHMTKQISKPEFGIRGVDFKPRSFMGRGTMDVRTIVISRVLDDV